MPLPSATVLVVDDSADIRDFLAQTVLPALGYAVLTAHDGPTGLEQARTVHPDLILTDMHMPGLTGLELAAHVWAEQPYLPIILMTAEGSESLAQRALRAGFADYLIKPFDPDELRRALNWALEQGQARAEAAHFTQRMNEIETLIAVGHNLTSGLDLDQALLNTTEAAVTLTGVEGGTLWLADERTGELVQRAAKTVGEAARAFRLPGEDARAVRVLQTGEAIFAAESQAQGWYVPIQIHGHRLGVLSVHTQRSDRALTQRDQYTLEALASYVAIAIENARLYARTEAERAELETILRETEDGVIVVDPEQRLILINRVAQEAFSVFRNDTSGQLLEHLLPNAQVLELFRSPGRGGEIVLEDGRVLNAHLTPIEGVGKALVMQDITHLKKLDRIKSEFVTAVSHDLRSPLTSVLGYVELIQRSGPLNEQQTEFVQRALQSVYTINALITDLLDLGRIEAGFDTQKEAASLTAIVHHVLETLQQPLEAKRQILIRHLPEGLPRILANVLRLRQMVSNLVENAIKYTPEGGEIHVAIRADGDQLILMVSDSGIGIAPGDQPYIFDKFYRASNVRTGYAGTGLGLSIVKSIVEAHGGRIWLDSRLNQGTTFSVVLPKHKE